MKITILTPRNFNFRRTVMSHGWYALPPFEFDDQKWTLARVIDLGSAKPVAQNSAPPRERGGDGGGVATRANLSPNPSPLAERGTATAQAKPVTVTMSQTKHGMLVKPSRQVGKRATDKIVRDVRHMFRLDDDMGLFYDAVSQQPEFAWIRSEGAGRLLRSPTVFEDLVKMICTTNCSWALTEKMVNSLVDELGRESNDGRKSFPTAEVMAQQSEKFYRDRVRSGYRAPYLKELAQRVASGELNVEGWLHAELPHDQFMKELKCVKGVGNYAAENLLKLLGRYDGLALDSWTRAQFAKLRNQGRKASDKKIARFYSRFKSWRGLALWCDMTRLWLEPERLNR